MVFHVWVALILNIVILSDWHWHRPQKHLTFLWRTFNMGKRNLNLELFVVVSWMNSWVSPFIIPDIICFGFFTLDTRMVKFFMKLGVKFHSFFLEKKGEIFVPFTLFEKWKWNENDWKSRSRSESEIKMTRDREVKFQKKSREFSRIETLAGHWFLGTITWWKRPLSPPFAKSFVQCPK